MHVFRKIWTEMLIQKRGKKFSISGIHLVRRKNFLVCSTNLGGCASCNLVRHMLVRSLQSRILLFKCIQWGTRVLQEALCVALETWWLLSKKKRNLSNAYSFCMDMEQDTGSGCQRIASQYHVSMHVSYEPDLCHLCSLTACAPKMKK